MSPDSQLKEGFVEVYGAQLAEIERLKTNLKDLLEAMSEETRPCRRCGQAIYFVRLARSKTLTPYTEDGVSHFQNCPHGKAGRTKKQVQQALIDTAPLPE